MKSGIYTARLGYAWLLKQAVPPNTNGSWSWVWSLKASEKFKFLRWLISYEALPMNALRANCHLANDPSCLRCACPIEDANHCFRECDIAMEIWSWMGLWQSTNSQQVDFKSWIYEHSRGLNAIYFLFTIWWLWRYMNNKIFRITASR